MSVSTSASVSISASVAVSSVVSVVSRALYQVSGCAIVSPLVRSHNVLWTVLSLALISTRRTCKERYLPRPPYESPFIFEVVEASTSSWVRVMRLRRRDGLRFFAAERTTCRMWDRGEERTADVSRSAAVNIKSSLLGFAQISGTSRDTCLEA